MREIKFDFLKKLFRKKKPKQKKRIRIKKRNIIQKEAPYKSIILDLSPPIKRKLPSTSRKTLKARINSVHNRNVFVKDSQSEYYFFNEAQYTKTDIHLMLEWYSENNKGLFIRHPFRDTYLIDGQEVERVFLETWGEI